MVYHYMLLISVNHVYSHCYWFRCYYHCTLLFKHEHANNLFLCADNVFSSLVGLQFFWQLLPKSGKADEKNHLIHVPLKETPLSDCGGFCGDLERQIEIEDQV